MQEDNEFPVGWIIIGFFIIVFAVIGGVARACQGPPPCQDYTRMISAFSLRKPEVVCGPGMTMTIKEKVQGALITCTCPK